MYFRIGKRFVGTTMATATTIRIATIGIGRNKLAISWARTPKVKALKVKSPMGHSIRNLFRTA